MRDWKKHNTVLDYNCPCQKDTGFFFMPTVVATELVSAGRCSEMDILLDLWMSAVCNDSQVQGSEIGPVGKATKMEQPAAAPIICAGERAIPVIDEADKMLTPKYSSSSENVSHSIASEGLKLMEGIITDIKSESVNYQVDTSKISFVLCGAFSVKADEITRIHGTDSPDCEFAAYGTG